MVNKYTQNHKHHYEMDNILHAESFNLPKARKYNFPRKLLVIKHLCSVVTCIQTAC